MEVSKCNFTLNIVIDMDSKNIIFFGGTVLIGNSVLNLLNKKESKIYAFSRQNLVNKFENVKEVIFNFDTLEADIELNNWDHIYICLGRRLKVWELIYIRKKNRENHFKIEHDYIIKILEKAKKLGARDVSIISAIGANSKSSNFFIFIYIKTSSKCKFSFNSLTKNCFLFKQSANFVTYNYSTHCWSKN